MPATFAVNKRKVESETDQLLHQIRALSAISSGTTNDMPIV